MRVHYFPSAEAISGSIGSGDLAGATINPVNIASGAITSGLIATCGVSSGNICSGQVGNVHVFSGGFGSGAIGSGQIGNIHIADGTIITADIASGQVQSGQLGSGAVTGQMGGGAFNIASGTIGPNDVGSGAIGSGQLSSGVVSRFHHASGAITSGHVGSGAVLGQGGGGAFCIASGTVITNDIGSGAIQSGQISSGVIGRFQVASGQFAGFELGSGAIVSGRIASGQIGNFHFASGDTIDSCRWMIDNSFTAGEPISGGAVGVGVAFTQSGILQAAMASVSGRMPAVGVAIANYTSGQTVTMYRGGKVFSTVFNFSGWMNRPVYVGRSGQLSASGAPTSSGDIQQIVGFSLQQSGLMVQLGDPLEEAIAGSGDVGSGAITGKAVSGGYFNIASGTIGALDMGSGAMVRTALQAGGTPMVSGVLTMAPVVTQITSEVVSGNCAVYSDSSGQIGVAMAAVSGRWPAVGIALGNALSGTTVAWAQVGSLQLTSGMADYSGYLGRRVWLGRSGQITTISGSWSSGGFASGDVGQPIGIIANSGAIHFNVFSVIWSGGPLGVAAGGTF